MMMRTGTVIQLWQFGDAFLILKLPTGVKYSNQTDGLSCGHPEEEGALVPLSKDLATELAKAYDLSAPEVTAAQINSILVDQDIQIVVDEELWKKSCEAWIHVRVYAPRNDDLAVLSNFESLPSQPLTMDEEWSELESRPRMKEYRAILTWPNSD